MGMCRHACTVTWAISIFTSAWPNQPCQYVFFTCEAFYRTLVVSIPWYKIRQPISLQRRSCLLRLAEAATRARREKFCQGGPHRDPPVSLRSRPLINRSDLSNRKQPTIVYWLGPAYQRPSTKASARKAPKRLDSIVSILSHQIRILWYISNFAWL